MPSKSNISDDIVRTTIGKWNNEDYESCEYLNDMVHSQGWEVLSSLWRNLEEAIWQRIQKESNDGQERNVYRLIGIREGFNLATRIHERVFVEKEEQNKINKRQEAYYREMPNIENREELNGTGI